MGFIEARHPLNQIWSELHSIFSQTVSMHYSSSLKLTVEQLLQNFCLLWSVKYRNLVPKVRNYNQSSDK
jgi:hypothetical protein